MKTFIIILSAIMFFTGTFAQQYFTYNQSTQKFDSSEKFNDEIVKKIIASESLIFEGEIIGTKKFIDTLNENAGNQYTLLLININHILSGNINTGIITMLIPWSIEPVTFDKQFGTIIGVTETDYIVPPPDIPKQGIYFCKASDKTPAGNIYPLSLTGNDNITVPIIQNYTFINLDSLEFYMNAVKKIKFTSKQNIYQFLSQYSNITIP